MTSSIMKHRLSLGKHEPVRFNIMIVGEGGLGKKTFIKSLFKSYYNEDDVFNGKDENLQNQNNLTSNLNGLLHQNGSDYPSNAVQITETGLITVNTTTGEAKFHLYNALGYGDNINNVNDFSIIKNDIINRHIQWRKLDAQILNDQSRSLLDNRIHCLLYFISPHRFKNMDLSFFEQLSDVVSIVPVISKCDCLTLTERNAMLLNIDKELKALSNKKGFNVCYDFMESELMSDVLSDSSKEKSNDNLEFNISPTMIQQFEGFEKSPIPSSKKSTVKSLITENLETSMVYEYEFFKSIKGKYEAEIEDSVGNKRKSEDIYDNRTDQNKQILSDDIETTNIERYEPGVTVIKKLTSIHDNYKIVPNIFAVISDLNGMRCYSWGQVSIYDDRNSDFRRLQQLLFEQGTHVRGMKEATQQKTIDLFSTNESSTYWTLYFKPLSQLSMMSMFCFVCTLVFTDYIINDKPENHSNYGFYGQIIICLLLVVVSVLFCRIFNTIISWTNNSRTTVSKYLMLEVGLWLFCTLILVHYIATYVQKGLPV